MTLEEESRLSCYKELTVLDEHKNIILVKNLTNNRLYVKKVLKIYNISVYEQLAGCHIEGVPGVVEYIDGPEGLTVIEEYIKGENLYNIISSGGVLNENKAYAVGCDLAKILLELQKLNPPVIHRDIKPSNIIISDDGRVYLVDFNTAKHNNEIKSQDTRLLGTRYFAAPEQYGFGQSDLRTDIYGFGVTINYLLTGSKPGDGIAKCRFSYILEKCLSIDPDKRYEDADSLYKALTKKKNKPWTDFLLPGFRNRQPAAMLLAVIWYAIVILLTFSCEFYTQDGKKTTGALLWADRITLFMMLMGSTLWFGNYLGIHSKMPGMRKKSAGRIIMLFVWWIVYIAACLTVLMVISEFI